MILSQFLFDTQYIILDYFQKRRVQEEKYLLLPNKGTPYGWLIIGMKLHYNGKEVKGN